MTQILLSLLVTILIPLSVGEALVQYTGEINLRSVITHQPLLVVAFLMSLITTIQLLVSRLNRKAPVPQPSSDAIALLSALQSKGRLLDFVSEDISAYSDAQVSAAARIVHSGCREVVLKSFSPEPIVKAKEGSLISGVEGTELNKYRLSGKVGRAPYSGKLVHHGWRATKTEVPSRSDNSLVIAPAELAVE